MEENVKQYESESAVEFLKRMQEAGFLFHGTTYPEEIHTFEPRKANDPEDKWNCDIAVFATHAPALSVIFALQKRGGNWSTHFTSGEGGIVKSVSAKIPKENETDLKGSKGYVYIFPRENFEGKSANSVQYKSKIPVSPIARVEVTFDDYQALGGTIEWT